MSSRRATTEESRELALQWNETGRVLARLRIEALASQSVEESRQAAWDMLHLGGLLPGDREHSTHSGLIEMQRLFGLQRARGRNQSPA